MHRLVQKWKTDPRVLEKQRNRRDAQKNARELNWSKATIVGCCAQLCNQAYYVNNPGMSATIQRIQAELLAGLQAKAAALGIKGDYTQLLPFEETRHGRKVLKLEKEYVK